MADQVATGVGADLRRAREAAGLAVGDVAQRLKLLPRQIESLEHERFDRLPGPSIARGLVRNYARLLNLDPEPLVERMTPPTEKAAASTPPSSNASRRSTFLYAGFSLALLVVIGALAYPWPQKNATPPSVAAVEPRRAEAPVEQPAAAETPPVVPEKAQPAAEPSPEVAAEPVPPPVAVHRLVLRMEEEAWLEVRDGTGRSLVSSLSAAGSERAVRGQPPFDLVIGNAANVKLTYDGKPVDLAPHIRGEVARLKLQ